MLNKVKLAIQSVIFEDKDSVVEFRKFSSRGGNVIYIDEKEKILMQKVERSLYLTYLHGTQWYNEKRFEFRLPEKLKDKLFTILEKTDFFTLTLNKKNKKEKDLIRISIRLKDGRKNTITDFLTTDNKVFLQIYDWFMLLVNYAEKKIDPIYEGEHKPEWITDSLSY